MSRDSESVFSFFVVFSLCDVSSGRLWLAWPSGGRGTGCDAVLWYVLLLVIKIVLMAIVILMSIRMIMVMVMIVRIW